MENNKYKVILDTDMENEIDDKFAFVYLLKSLDRFDLKAITIAPFFGSKYSAINNIKEGINQSYKTTLKILDMLRIDYKNIVYKGSTDFMVNGYSESTEAVDKIIELAHQNPDLYIIAIGAITNVALAIKKDPSIVSNLNIIWLGGNSFLYNKNDEFNFNEDILAVKTVFSSGVKLTVIPCRNVASDLVTTIYELEHYLKDKSEIGNYLCSEFDKCKPRTPGMSKTIWDLSAVAYLINPKWFVTETIPCPIIDEDGSYILNKTEEYAVFVKDLRRNHIYGDFFTKMEGKND